MKIGLISKEFKKGSGQGVYEYAYNLYSNLKEKCSLEPITASGYGTFSKNFMSEQILLPLKIIPKRSDVYHAVCPEDGCWLPSIKRKTVVTFHDIIPLIGNERHPIFKIYFKFCTNMASKADIIISDSEFTKNKIVERLGVNSEKIKVVHLGVDQKIFKPNKKLKEKDFLKIGYLGGFGERKNIDVLIKAFSKLDADAKLILGGRGPQKRYLKELVKKLGVQNKVIFKGFIPQKDIVNFYQNLDLFVFPSSIEGFGIPLIEAMSCGIPVVTSNTSSMPEIVSKAGIKVQPNNENALKNAIQDLISDKSKLKKMSKLSLERSKHFKLDSFISKTFDIYNEVNQK